MESDLVLAINSVAESIKHLETSIQMTSHKQWWDTQWFSAVIGATTGFVGTWIYSAIKTRNERLFQYYRWFLHQGTFSDPEGLLGQAVMTTYGADDKSLAEKMVIALRSHTKYWYEPMGRFRFLMKSYEKSISRIKNGARKDVKNHMEYKRAEKRFRKVMDLVYRKTGESEWTS
jgi:hypothetical protein